MPDNHTITFRYLNWEVEFDPEFEPSVKYHSQGSPPVIFRVSHESVYGSKPFTDEEHRIPAAVIEELIQRTLEYHVVKNAKEKSRNWKSQQ